MKIIVDFNLYREKGNLQDFQNAEQLYVYNRGIVNQRLRKFHMNLLNSDNKVGSTVFIMNSGPIRFSPIIKTLCFILTKQSLTEASYALIAVGLETENSNQRPGPAGPEETRIGSE